MQLHIQCRREDNVKPGSLPFYHAFERNQDAGADETSNKITQPARKAAADDRCKPAYLLFFHKHTSLLLLKKFR